MGKLATFRDLDRAERLGAFEAASLLLIARMLVSLVPFRLWQARLGKIGNAAEDHVLSPLGIAQVGIVRRSIARVTRHAPLDFICLPRALAARWMLARRGIGSELAIGVRALSHGEKDFHAWLMVAGDFVTGDCEPADYARLARDSAA